MKWWTGRAAGAEKVKDFPTSADAIDRDESRRKRGQALGLPYDPRRLCSGGRGDSPIDYRRVACFRSRRTLTEFASGTPARLRRTGAVTFVVNHRHQPVAQRLASSRKWWHSSDGVFRPAARDGPISLKLAARQRGLTPWSAHRGSAVRIADQRSTA